MSNSAYNIQLRDRHGAAVHIAFEFFSSPVLEAFSTDVSLDWRTSSGRLLLLLAEDEARRWHAFAKQSSADLLVPASLAASISGRTALSN